MLGLVVCDDCSSKRCFLGDHKPAGASAPSSAAVRVCDAAYNIVRQLQVYSEQQRAALAKKRDEVRAHQAFLAQEEAERSQLGLAEGGTGAAGKAASSGQDGGKAGGTRQQQAAVGGAASAAHEAMDALKERGGKIGVLNERVAELGKDAEDFFESAKKIRQQAERQSRWF